MIVDPYEFAGRRGAASYRRGEPWPPYEPKDKTAMVFWYGYHKARMRDVVSRIKAMRALGVEE